MPAQHLWGYPPRPLPQVGVAIAIHNLLKSDFGQTRLQGQECFRLPVGDAAAPPLAVLLPESGCYLTMGYGHRRS